MKRSFIVRLHRGLSNSKEIVFGLHRMSGREKSKAAASRANKKSRSVRTGLQFPVGRIHRIIGHIGDLKQEVNNPGEQNPETHLTPAETAAVKAQALTKVKEENLKHIASGLGVNQPTLPHGLGSIFVTPPKTRWLVVKELAPLLWGRFSFKFGHIISCNFNFVL